MYFQIVSPLIGLLQDSCHDISVSLFYSLFFLYTPGCSPDGIVENNFYRCTLVAIPAKNFATVPQYSRGTQEKRSFFFLFLHF